MIKKLILTKVADGMTPSCGHPWNYEIKLEKKRIYVVYLCVISYYHILIV